MPSARLRRGGQRGPRHELSRPAASGTTRRGLHTRSRIGLGAAAPACDVRALWIAQFASNVGTWMQTVGAQWLLIDTTPLLASLVQTAASLPIVLLALPAG